MADAYRKLKVGPALSDLDVGPVVSRRQQDIVEGYIGLAERGRARLAAQGTIVSDAPAGGAYVTLTLIRDVPQDHRLVQEEIFGPVQVIMPFDREQLAIEFADGTPFGLVWGIWTSDGGRQLRLARFSRDRFSSTTMAPAAASKLPFGGVKRSGHGREKGFKAFLRFCHDQNHLDLSWLTSRRRAAS